MKMKGSLPQIGFFLGLILFALLMIFPAPAGLSPEGWKVAACALLMAVWWVTEAIPIPATSLLPLFLFPTLGIVSSREAAAPYADHLIFLFMGGFFIAVTMEKWNLHKRLALITISFFGTQPHRLILGFMVSTAVLSMWISNTATVMMMLPIALSVIRRAQSAAAANPTGANDSSFAVALMLGIAYAASIGGTGTLIGTPPNTVLAGFVEKTYGQPIRFATWMALGVPLVVTMLVLCWIYLTRIAFRFPQQEISGGRQLILQQLRELGPWSGPEIKVMAVFTWVAVAWIARGMIDIPALKFVHDSTIAMSGALILFMLPSRKFEGENLLDWETALKIPWGVVLLFGGGLSLAGAFSSTGLADYIGLQLNHLSHAPLMVLIIATVLFTTFLTEMTSNTATSTMLIPLMAGLAAGIGIHPFGLLFGATIAASFAFMLPIATPPNAVVFGSGVITMTQMARTGFVLNILGTIVISIFVKFAVPIIWNIDLGSAPLWSTPGP